MTDAEWKALEPHHAACRIARDAWSESLMPGLPGYGDSVRLGADCDIAQREYALAIDRIIEWRRDVIT